jgi:hypothetical protein
MRQFLIGAILVCAPGMAAALGYECAFDKTCVEGKSCQPSSLTVKVSTNAEGVVTFSTGGRNMKARYFVDPSRETRSYVTELEFNTIFLLSVFDTVPARLTQHTPLMDLQSMTHIGECKETP